LTARLTSRTGMNSRS